MSNVNLYGIQIPSSQTIKYLGLRPSPNMGSTHKIKKITIKQSLTQLTKNNNNNSKYSCKLLYAHLLILGL